MPAVDLTRLRFQIEELFSFLEKPGFFHLHLKDLFSLYAHRALRIGDSARPSSMIPQYQLPDPVLRQIKLDLPKFLKEDNDNALSLADELWEDPYFEIKQLAIFILNHAAAKDPESVISRIKSWLIPDLDQIVVVELLSSGTQNLREIYPQTWETLMGSYLADEKPKMISFGLQGLTAGVERGSVLNLPAIYRMISPILQYPMEASYNKLIDLMEALSRRSPTETAFFLRQTVAISDSPETVRVIKQVLPFFPGEIQKDLRTLVVK